MSSDFFGGPNPDLSDPYKRLAYRVAMASETSAEREEKRQDKGREQVTLGKGITMTGQEELTRDILIAIIEKSGDMSYWDGEPSKLVAWVVETHKRIADAVKAEWPAVAAHSSSSRGR